MRQLSRVVWSEGMYLGPHNFQLQSRWFENSVDFASAALWFAPYGLLACELNRDGLLNGILSVTHARGIFSDGLPFHLGEFDPIPEPRSIKTLFPPTDDYVVAYLTVASYKPGQQNTASSGSGSFRYSPYDRTAVDENTGLDEKTVSVARKNIRILLESELDPSLERLPIARIRRSADGTYVADEDFIPVCLKVSASSRLMMITGRLIEILSDRTRGLSAGRQDQRPAAQGLSPRELAAFWFQHSLNSALPVLRHLCYTEQGHPEELFRELSRLAGGLCTFGLNSHPDQLPLYDHQNLESCFGRLDAFIRAHLNLLEPPNRVVIPLRKEGPFYFGDITDSRCLTGANWFLAVRAPMDEAALIAQVPHGIKVCSGRFIDRIVKAALPGLPLRHLSAPPAAASPRFDSQYFSISQEGACWTTLLDAKQVGIFVPNELPNPEMELIVLLAK